MAIIARKCLLSISWLETSALQGVNINKLSWGLQHTSAKSCRFSGVAARAQWFADKMGSCVFRRVSQKKTYRLSFIDPVSSYLLSSCRLWSISSACSICIDFACLCPRCIVCWIWKKKLVERVCVCAFLESKKKRVESVKLSELQRMIGRLTD